MSLSDPQLRSFRKTQFSTGAAKAVAGRYAGHDAQLDGIESRGRGAGGRSVLGQHLTPQWREEVWPGTQPVDDAASLDERDVWFRSRDE
jgi:hypothetical protein